MTSLTCHTVQSWLCCVLNSSVHKLAGMSHYTVTVQVTMSSHVELTLSDIVTESGTLCACNASQLLCQSCISTRPNCFHYCLPCAREGPCSHLVGGPLAHQVQHTICWATTVGCFNGLNDWVLHTEEGTKVTPFCIQSVV